MQNNPQSYNPTWTSLRKHQTPQWLIDAKFGIYSHWGPTTVRCQPRNENMSLDEAIDRFTAENFDPQAWASLFKQAGARFAGVITWHGSPFLHWDSALSDFNSVQRSPHIDIVGQLSRAIRAQGMKFVATYHAIGGDHWISLAQESVNKYQPDIFWVDASFGGTKQGHHLKVVHNAKFIGESPTRPHFLEEKYQREFLAYYYNHALAHEKTVEFVYKSHDIPPGIGMRDIENGLLDQMAYDVWMTDIDMNIPPDWATHGWFYRETLPLRSAENLVNILVDVVSKNGILLLNVPPKADGTFTSEIHGTLAALGRWLEINGEAIYGASPWFVFGEGPTDVESGNYSFHHSDHFAQTQFTPEDIRFTVNGDALYATCLGRLGAEVAIKALRSTFKLNPGDIQSVSLLGSDADLNWEHTETALVIQLPEQCANVHAPVFKIQFAW